MKCSSSRHQVFFVTLAHLNPRPRLAPALRDMKGQPAGQFVVMDIGARRGGETYLQPLAGQIKLIGFDDSPEEECKPGEASAIQYEHHETRRGRAGKILQGGVALLVGPVQAQHEVLRAAAVP